MSNLPAITIKKDQYGYYCQPYLGKNNFTGKASRPRRSFPEAKTEAEAKVMAKAWLEELLGQGPLLVDRAIRYCDEMEIAGARINTIRRYRIICENHLKAFFKTYRLKEVTAQDIVDFEGELLASGLSSVTVAQIHWFLSGFFTHLLMSGEIESSPIAGVTSPRKMSQDIKPLSQEEFAKLMLYCESVIRDVNQALFSRETVVCMAVWISLHTGLRVGEVCALRQRDLNGITKTLMVTGTIVQTGSGLSRQSGAKRGSDRRIQLSQAEFETLQMFCKLCKRYAGLPSDYDSPLISWNGSWMSPNVVSTIFSKSIKDPLELSAAVTFHTLRHTHATYLLYQGVPAEDVRRRLGHADIETTLRFYGHAMPGSDGRVTEAFGSVLENIFNLGA